MSKNIGFVSTRFAGTDGVSLESSKWAHVFEDSGHKCFWFAGLLDRNKEQAFCIPEAYFQHQQNRWIVERIFGNKGRQSGVTESIHILRAFLKARLHKFIEMFKIDILIAENVLSIPMHVSLGLALAETIAETQIPTIAHHHDFYWERSRFSVNAVNDYLRMAFPPALPNIEHVVINSAAREELAHRTGLSSHIIPNVFDFENPPEKSGKHNGKFKESIGLRPDDIMILQPTRIVKRKGIEFAVELVRELKESFYKLVISHEAGDEGFEYADKLKEYARGHGVDLLFIMTGLDSPRTCCANQSNRYSLWDVYQHADFITYPSLIEGFGNAFLEAVYFKKPILINRYETFVRDIEPQGFDLVVMDGFLTQKTVRDVKSVLESSKKKERMVQNNYAIASRLYSYSLLRKRLNAIMMHFFGDAANQIATIAPTTESQSVPQPFPKVASFSSVVQGA